MPHPYPAKASLDTGALGWNDELALLVSQGLERLAPGELLEVLSQSASVDAALPAFCLQAGNELVSRWRDGEQHSALVSKGPFRHAGGPQTPRRSQEPAANVTVPQLAVMGIGSWPRPRWMLRALHECLAGKISSGEFHESADDAVRLAVQAQLSAGADVLTDGEQRRDDFASFAAALLEGCRLAVIDGLAASAKDPEALHAELRALNVPAGRTRHPVVTGKLRRVRPLAIHELVFVQSIAPGHPVKIALPGPYLLTRTLWLESLQSRHYQTREALAADVVTALREEALELLAQGAALVQFDEPVLSEVVFGAARARAAGELVFAQELLAAACRGLPRERLALHVCRGNDSADESSARAGDYRPLLPLLSKAPVGALFLELATPRAGELALLAELPEDKRIAAGVVNQKMTEVEPLETVAGRAARALQLFGKDRLLLTPDCGFATFADNPLAAEAIAAAKLATISAAARRLRLGK